MTHPILPSTNQDIIKPPSGGSAPVVAPRPPRPNRGGAPLGNRNALKHGLYARHFPEELKTSLARCELDDFAAEIQLLRVCMDAIVRDLVASTTADETRVRQTNAIANAVSSLVRASCQHLLNRSDHNPLLVAWFETVSANPFFIDDPRVSA